MNTRLGLATVVIWHNADHYGQMTLHLRLNGIVPPASLSNPPKVKTLTEVWRYFSRLHRTVHLYFIVRIHTGISICTFSYKSVSLARVSYGFHNLRRADRGRHGITRASGSSQPARKQACCHFETAFAPKVHPNAVLCYRWR